MGLSAAVAPRLRLLIGESIDLAAAHHGGHQDFAVIRFAKREDGQMLPFDRSVLSDLPFLGIDSRLVASGQFQHDDVRGQRVAQRLGLYVVAVRRIGRTPAPARIDPRSLSRPRA